MHSSHSGETALLHPNMLAQDRHASPEASSAAKGEAWPWGGSQTCRDHGSLRAGQVTCLPTCLEGHHSHIGVWYDIYFLYLFSKITGETMV